MSHLTPTLNFEKCAQEGYVLKDELLEESNLSNSG